MFLLGGLLPNSVYICHCLLLYENISTFFFKIGISIISSLFNIDLMYKQFWRLALETELDMTSKTFRVFDSMNFSLETFFSWETRPVLNRYDDFDFSIISLVDMCGVGFGSRLQC